MQSNDENPYSAPLTIEPDRSIEALKKKELRLLTWILLAIFAVHLASFFFDSVKAHPEPNVNYPKGTLISIGILHWINSPLCLGACCLLLRFGNRYISILALPLSVRAIFVILDHADRTVIPITWQAGMYLWLSCYVMIAILSVIVIIRRFQYGS